jgi:GNAT superfamily N-acetyltransferase
MTLITIHPVRSKKDQHDFYHLAWQVYRNDPYWVPPPWPTRKVYLDKKSAFFSYGEGEFWLAKRGSQVVGTIGTAIDHPRNKHTGRQTGLFGFFEVLEDDFAAASALWDHACAWSKARGLSELLGPYSFAANEDPGFLVEGFDCAPTIMMGHNPPYYVNFAEKYGFQSMDGWLAYRFDLAKINYNADQAPQIFHRVAERSRSRLGSSSIRHPVMDNWAEEIQRLHAVYNASLAVLPEFTPIELVEFNTQALSLKPLLDPELVFIAEVAGKVVGFSLGLPNIMEALKLANGLLYPWDYLRFALAKRRITGVSFKILAVDPLYWGYGLEAQMFVEMGKAVISKGYTWIDLSLTGENNPQTNKLARRLGASVYRRYRDYKLKLSGLTNSS